MKGVIQLVGPQISRKCTEDYTRCLHKKCVIHNKSNYIGNDSKWKIYILGDYRFGHCEKTSSYEHVSNSNYWDTAVWFYKHKSVVNDQTER
jgi:hypothetical protein